MKYHINVGGKLSWTGFLRKKGEEKFNTLCIDYPDSVITFLEGDMELYARIPENQRSKLIDSLAKTLSKGE